jgi:hypothetical protein
MGFPIKTDTTHIHFGEKLSGNFETLGVINEPTRVSRLGL